MTAKKTAAAPSAGRLGKAASKASVPAARRFVRDDDRNVVLRPIPVKPKGWRFEPTILSGLGRWFEDGVGEPLLITGDAGSGKTSSVLAFAAEKEIPVVVFTARPRMDRRELIGRWVLGPDGMYWQDGPAALAWRHGWILLVNEFSAAPPEVWVSANDLLEGLPLEIDQTGEVIPRHPQARIVFTDNTRGHSSEIDSGYFGRHVQDRSVIDRMWHLRAPGLSEADEARVLFDHLNEKLVERVGETIAREVCGLTAKAALGSRVKASESSIGFENRSFALSIRVGRRLAGLLLRHVAAGGESFKDPIAQAADLAVGNALDRPVRDALVTYLKTIFGERLEELVRDLLAADAAKKAEEARLAAQAAQRQAQHIAVLKDFVERGPIYQKRRALIAAQAQQAAVDARREYDARAAQAQALASRSPSSCPPASEDPSAPSTSGEPAEGASPEAPEVEKPARTARKSRSKKSAPMVDVGDCEDAEAYGACAPSLDPTDPMRPKPTVIAKGREVPTEPFESAPHPRYSNLNEAALFGAERPCA